MEGNVEEENIEIWKLKKLIKSLQNAKGNGTCMISLLIPGKEQLSRVNQTLTNELGAAANIKDRVNRNSVLSAIVSTQQRLKLYNRVPSNGLAIYCGTILTPEGQEKMINIDFEPCRPIKHSLYLCDNVFHTEALLEILESDEKFGFIVVDGNGALFGTLMGNTREVIHRLAVSLPKKHGRGGQSAPRFGRIRLEKRHNYLRKVAEIASQVFLNHDSANVHGIVLAGSAEFKSELVKSDLVDPRLAKLIIKIVDIAYGGMAGFNQAIDLAQDALSNVKFVQEKKVIEAFFDEVAQDSGKYLFGIQECLKTLESGAVETLIVWDSLEISRWKLRNPVTEEETIVYLSPTEEANFSLKDPSSQTLLEIEERGPLVDWLSENYQKYGSCLQLVTGRSSQGAQFVRGFGGVGALLRYQVASSTQEYESDDFYDSEEEQQVFDY